MNLYEEGVEKKEKVAENTSGSLRALAMTANEIRIEQAERRLYAILDRHTRLIEGLTKMMKADDLEEDMQKNLKETNSMLDDCFWQFLSPLEPGDKVVSAYDTHMVEGSIVSIQKESTHQEYGSAMVQFPNEGAKTVDVCELVKVWGSVLHAEAAVPGKN
jgi:hypothetical protein